MRPAGRGELDSLYFDYPHFDPPAPASRGDGERHDVVIVGAGPVGLLAALVLARNGVASVVVEKKATFNDGSRAICLQRHSFHILERAGAVERFVETALPWTTGRSFYRGKQILEFEMPYSADDKFMPMYNLQQQFIEQYLWQAAAANPLVDIRWQTEAKALDRAGDAVELLLGDPAGDYRVSADWVLAADGAHSGMRKQCGLRLAGENFEGRYVIADILAPIDHPTIRRALFEPACRPHGTVLLHRQPENIWRIDYQLDEGEDAQEALNENNIRANVEAVLAETGYDGDYELEWWSVYTANTLALDDYRHGRVLFIGDSAHIVPIFGVRGLNNGLADAENIGWKLARVLKGEAGDRLLDSYTPERRGATLDIFANASKSTRFMTPPGPGWTLMRDAALSLSLDHAFAGQFANPRQMQPYTYADGPLTLAGDWPGEAGPPPGAVMLDVALADGAFLSDRLAPGFTGLLFDPPDDMDVAGLQSVLQEADALAGLVVVSEQDSGRIAERYGASGGTLYLIRPDMHVAARWQRADVAELRQTLRSLLQGSVT